MSKQYDYALTDDIVLLNDRKDTEQKIYNIFINSPFAEKYVYHDKAKKIIKDDIFKIFYYTKDELLKIKKLNTFEYVLAIADFYDFNFDYIIKKVLSPKIMCELLQDIYDMNQQSFEDKYKKIVIPAFMQELLAQKELLNKQQQTKNAKVVAYRIAQCLREISEKKEARLLSAYIKYGKLNNPNEDSTFEKEELDVMSEIISLAEEVQTMHKEDYSEQKEIAFLEEMASIIDSLISEHSCQNDSYKVIELEASPISMLDDKFEKVLKHQISKISTLIGSSQADQEFMEGEIYDDGNKNDTSSITGNRIS